MLRPAVGVTPEQMISQLDSGINMRDVLAFLAAKVSGAAYYPSTLEGAVRAMHLKFLT